MLIGIVSYSVDIRFESGSARTKKNQLYLVLFLCNDWNIWARRQSYTSSLRFSTEVKTFASKVLCSNGCQQGKVKRWENAVNIDYIRAELCNNRITEYSCPRKIYICVIFWPVSKFRSDWMPRTWVLMKIWIIWYIQVWIKYGWLLSFKCTHS